MKYVNFNDIFGMIFIILLDIYIITSGNNNKMRTFKGKVMLHCTLLF